MAEALSAELRTARKAHVCDWCNRTIDAGTKYRRWACVDMGSMVTVRAHRECCDAADDVASEWGDEAAYFNRDHNRGCSCGSGESCEDDRCRVRFDAAGEAMAEAVDRMDEASSRLAILCARGTLNGVAFQEADAALRKARARVLALHAAAVNAAPAAAPIPPPPPVPGVDRAKALAKAVRVARIRLAQARRPASCVIAAMDLLQDAIDAYDGDVLSVPDAPADAQAVEA